MRRSPGVRRPSLADSPRELTDLKAVFSAALARPAGPERSASSDAACRGDGFLESGAIAGPDAVPGDPSPIAHATAVDPRGPSLPG
jgi:hypothetical protein